MRAPRLALFLSTAALLTATGVHAQTAPAEPAAAPAPADAANFTDDELLKYDAAITRVRAVVDALNGAEPTAEQQGEMAAAVQDSGLDVTRFNTIMTAAAEDPILPARIKVLKTPAPAAGSVAAGVNETELTQFVQAMTAIRAITATVQNGQATPEQSAQLTAAVQNSGLAVDRFNEVATAVSQDASLQARAELITVRQAAAQ